jgi:hypothetical protein
MRLFDWIMLVLGVLGAWAFLGTVAFQVWRVWSFRRAISRNWDAWNAIRSMKDKQAQRGPDWGAIRARRQEGAQTYGNSGSPTGGLPRENPGGNRPYGVGHYAESGDKEP